jgi:hypothetical protein
MEAAMTVQTFPLERATISTIEDNSCDPKQESLLREGAIATTLSDLELLGANLFVTPWSDPVIEELGLDPRSLYVERFWLCVLGPSATWLLRALSYGLEGSPEGFSLPPRDFARVLGLGERTGKQSPLVRSVNRLCHFQLGYLTGTTFHVRLAVPWLDRRQVVRLPMFLQREHALWDAADQEENPPRALRRRAALTASGLAKIGGSQDEIRRLLYQSHTHPTVANALAEWALQQQQMIRSHAVA